MYIPSVHRHGPTAGQGIRTHRDTHRFSCTGNASHASSLPQYADPVVKNSKEIKNTDKILRFSAAARPDKSRPLSRLKSLSTCISGTPACTSLSAFLTLVRLRSVRPYRNFPVTAAAPGTKTTEKCPADRLLFLSQTKCSPARADTAGQASRFKSLFISNEEINKSRFFR